MNTLGMKFVPVPGTEILMCIHETRRKDYSAYADAVPGVDATWKNPMVEGKLLIQSDEHPVVEVSWEDATAFCAWLSKKEGRAYRLPTEREWNLAVAFDIDDPGSISDTNLKKIIGPQYPWGTRDQKDAPRYGNYWGKEDGHEGTAPVMSFLPNRLGIYDLGGNAWEWCEGWFDGNQAKRVLRGCGYLNGGPYRSSGTRESRDPGYRFPVPPLKEFTRGSIPGFRVVLDISPSERAVLSATTTAPAAAVSSSVSVAATKDAPFVNTLGMKFVPVPITGVPSGGQRVLFSIWETRVKDYAEFARVNRVASEWATQQKDGVPVSREPEYPVCGVSWKDANAFCKWLTEKETAEGKLPNGMRYRLPTDEEWSRAVGLPKEEGATPQERSSKNGGDFPWGTDFPPKAKVGNYADETFHEKFPLKKNERDNRMDNQWIEGYTDGYVTTSPVGSFAPNGFGIYDLDGNVLEWCEDKSDSEDSRWLVRRGGSCFSPARNYLLSSTRSVTLPAAGSVVDGFRCVLAPATSTPPAATIDPVPADFSTVSITAATKDAPFENTLGMKFVPVPITGGPSGGQRVLFSIWETRVQDYELFAKETKREWKKPDFEQGPTHPAVNVNWDNAQAFCVWLTERERKMGRLAASDWYRLPSDHEWSCAAGIGEREDAARTPEEKNDSLGDVFPWGVQWPPPAGSGNFGGEETKARRLAAGDDGKWKTVIAGYRDDYEATAPVGSFGADARGLCDLGGNVREWCGDVFNGHGNRVCRGASWFDTLRSALHSSSRKALSPSYSLGTLGLRVVLVTSLPSDFADRRPASSPTPAQVQKAP